MVYFLLLLGKMYKDIFSVYNNYRFYINSKQLLLI